MARLVYATIASLDGYINDERGEFGWAEPERELHEHFTELARATGTYLYGRRMHQTMAAWHDLAEAPDLEPHARDFARAWLDADKIVYSTTLPEPDLPRTTVDREFDPDAVRRLKAASDRDIAIGGATLAAHALTAGLVDEIQIAVVPAIVGGGTRALPDGLRLDLRLREIRDFPRGAVLLRYVTL